MHEPIAALSESQTWCHGGFELSVCWSGERLVATVATEGSDGELPANRAAVAWVDAAAAGIPGVTREPGPRWLFPPASWDGFRGALAVWLSLRSLRYRSHDPALVARMSAQLRGDWHVAMSWQMSPASAVMLQFGSRGSLQIDGGDPYLDALREVLGVAIEAPSPAKRRVLEIRRDHANCLFERAASWSPETLCRVSAAIYGQAPGAARSRRP